MPELRLTARARRDLEALPESLRNAVLETLTLLQTDPEQTGKSLVGRLRGLWSARIGSYRVLHTIEAGTVMVRAISHRETAYGNR